MEKLGREPDPEKAPLEIYHFPIEVQEAFAIHALLPDRWEGMNGVYLGKDWSALEVMLDIFDIEHKRDVVVFLKYIDHYNALKINNKAEQQRKSQEKQESSSPGTKIVKG